MKANYQKPAILIATIAPQLMTAASPLENGFDLDVLPETLENSGNLSRWHNSLWDDDEE